MAANEAYDQVLTNLKSVADVAQGTAKVITGLTWRHFRPELASGLLTELEAAMEDVRTSLGYWAERGPRQTTVDEVADETEQAPSRRTKNYAYADGQQASPSTLLVDR